MSAKIFVIFVFLSITSACLITNCPRGGKRNYEDSSNESENVSSTYIATFEFLFFNSVSQIETKKNVF